MSSPVPSPALASTVGGSLFSPILVDESTGGDDSEESASPIAMNDALPTEDELLVAWRTNRDHYGGNPTLTDADDYAEWRGYHRRGPCYLASASGGRLGNPNPNHPCNQESPSPMLSPPI